MDPELLQELSEAQIDSLLALPDDELLKAIAQLRAPSPDTASARVSQIAEDVQQSVQAAQVETDNLSLGRSVLNAIQSGYYSTAGALAEFYSRAGAAFFTDYFSEQSQLLQQAAEAVPTSEDVESFEVGNALENPALAGKWLATRVAGTLPNTVPSLVAGILSGGTSFPVQAVTQVGVNLPQITGFILQDAATDPETGEYKEQLSAREYIAAGAAGVISSGFESFADLMLVGRFNKLLRPTDLTDPVKRAVTEEANSAILRAAKGTLAQGNLEGFTEATQSIIENLGARYGWDPDRAITNDIIESYVIGFGAGALFGGAAEVSSEAARSLATPDATRVDQRIVEEVIRAEEVAALEAQIDEQIADETGRASEPLEEERLAEGSEALAEEVADSPAEEALAPEEAAGRAPVESADTAEEASAFTEDVALNKRATVRVRQALDLAQLAPAKRKGWDQAINNANQRGLVSDADILAQRAIADPKMAVDDDLRAAWLLRTAELQIRLKEAIRRGNDAVVDGDVTGHQAAVAEVNGLIDHISDLQQASKLTATEQARSIAFLGAGLNRELYEQGILLARAQMGKGKRLSDTERNFLSRKADEMETVLEREDRMTTRFEERVEEISREKAQAAINTMRRKRRATEKTIREREDAKAKLRALGLEVNTGINPEQAAQLARLIRTYVEEGVTRLDEVIRTVRRDIPALEPRDVIDTLAGRLAQKQAERQSRKDLIELQKQSRLVAEAEDLLGTTVGAPKKVRRKVMDSETVKELRRLVAEINERASRTTREAERLADIRERLHLVLEAIANEEAIPFQRRRQDSPNVQEALRELREARSLMRLEETKRELRRQLRAKVFVIPEKAARREASIELQEARAEVRALRRQIDIAVQALSPFTAKDIVLAAFELPRNMLSSGDIGGLGRQGIYHTLNPFNAPKTVRAGKAMVESLLSGRDAGRIQEMIRSHSLYPIMRQARLAIKDLDDLRYVDRETVVRNNLVERLAARQILQHEEVNPGLAALAEYMRASERNMIVALNFLRAEIFIDFYKKNPALTMDAYKAYAHYVNVTTGHGPAPTAGKAGEMADMINRFFFSFRLLSSRIVTPYVAIKTFAKVPEARKQVTQDFGGFMVGSAAVMFLGSLMGEMEFDPDDSDFLKIQVGNIRLDPFGGYGQAMRTMARTGLLADGVRELTGNEAPQGRPDDDFYGLWGTFLKYKLAPGLTGLVQLAFGKDPLGQDISRGEALLRSLTPIMAQESFDAFKETGSVTAALGTLMLSNIGIGVSVFDDPLKMQGVDNVLQRADYIPQARYPEGATDEEKAQLKREFRERMAERILPNSEFYMSLQPEDLKERLQEIAQEVR